MRPTLGVLFILLVSTPLFSQTTTGTIEGTVKVDTGEALPNTRVVATNEATGLTRQTTSDGDGFYRFSALLPGVYSVSVDLQNFSAQNRAGVQVIVGQTATVNF
jgi:Carboxypeptidase regulatory-like domain